MLTEGVLVGSTPPALGGLPSGFDNVGLVVGRCVNRGGVGLAVGLENEVCGVSSGFNNVGFVVISVVGEGVG